MPLKFHPTAIRASTVFDTPNGAMGSTRRKREASTLRSVGAGCGDDTGIVRRGLVSER